MPWNTFNCLNQSGEHNRNVNLGNLVKSKFSLVLIDFHKNEVNDMLKAHFCMFAGDPAGSSYPG